MNMDLTELVFILDRSGSMGGLESDTIGGFNGRALSKAVTCEAASDFLADDWKDDIEKYHEESQKKKGRQQRIEGQMKK